MSNPPNAYAPPKANLEPPPDTSGLDAAQLERLRTGQRLVILAILISFAMTPFNMAVNDSAYAMIMVVLSIANLILIVIGMYRLSSGHGYGTLVSIIFCILAIIPLIGLILMIGLSISATGKLQKAGYKVGLLGAKAK